MWNMLRTLVLVALSCNASGEPPAVRVEPLLDSGTTVLGNPFAYPAGPARISAFLVTVPPGALLPPHRHPVPVFGYVLQGELEVDYGSAGQRIYRAGDALIEAFRWAHSGRNPGREDARILAVYAGADGVDNTLPVPALD